MLISEFDYNLPPGLIAQEPLAERSASRMLIVDRSTGRVSDRMFTDLPDLLSPKDLVVMNDTRVFPARLQGSLDTGGRIELFLVRDMGNRNWECLARPAKRLKPGKIVVFAEDLSAEVIEKSDDGKVIINLRSTGDLDPLIDKYGRTPLPPYIKREQKSDPDRERYQTVYAKKRGAIAAPTAGLHFTQDVLERLERRHINTARITLHVGYGTFEPVRVEETSRHSVMAERYEISAETAGELNEAVKTKRRIVAIGTTTTRALESNLRDGSFVAGQHTADLTITPGYKFKAVGALLTNFHLPKSSLLILTSTFGGHELIMKAYRHAVEQKYRFYSYGDCMLIV
ncbi:MAG: tRNA preQ1(34) S-adenosylmethionine ribosyltransferase-isomerase QueA [Acidobacteria bacterium]|nr:tRNA preQ1(34) S-adenosylmethionine ribosyltransferase-isomerase QueA [Acidobacteriota bacterium]